MFSTLEVKQSKNLGEIDNTDKFSLRMTVESKPDGGKLGRLKSVGTRAS
ncbi:hypothetical protein E2C01_035036 [Portunus trituberculatus]|uniref:Uncharacterized protein n=1 Tax=Portunus trituberculatus TaxID=210409 RepID=A0A5B7F777_PORTR|nr:hypothetical protein [Portunus trituberculatus]